MKMSQKDEEVWEMSKTPVIIFYYMRPCGDMSGLTLHLVKGIEKNSSRSHLIMKIIWISYEHDVMSQKRLSENNFN